MGLRFSRAAAARMRAAIREAGGVEVFAIGDVDGIGRVSGLEIHCRGDEGAVPALLTRPRNGQVVIHNHPSGVLRPSAADFALANRYGDEGVGVVIVDNDLDNDFWVVEPARKVAEPIDRDRLRAFFLEDLPRVMRGAEPRPQQLEMALSVADALDGGEVLVIEAGTGTGKSLAYLAPAVLWALANDSKVAVSTYTRPLQAQLLCCDIPYLRAAGIEFEAALVKGRSNYICRRKLIAAGLDPGPDERALGRLAAFAATAEEGSVQELGEELDEALRERVVSHADQTLRARCPHYNQCFYYGARRRAAASHLLVLNHALLLADLSLKAQTDGDGVLPRFGRVVLDEGHHLEDAATSVLGERLTARAVTRAIAPLLDRKRRTGALSKLAERFGTDANGLAEACGRAKDELAQLHQEIEPRFELMGAAMLEPRPTLRVTDELQQAQPWSHQVVPTLSELERDLRSSHNRLAAIAARLDETEIPPEQAQPVLDLARGLRRLREKADASTRFRRGSEGRVRWFERERGPVALCEAPVDVAPTLRDLLWERMEAATVTSATLAVGGRFEHWMERHGAPEQTTCDVLASPFDFEKQALLALPRDLPRPDEHGWLEACGALSAELLRRSGGGAFVLCTSHAQVRFFGEALRRDVGGELPVLQQGRGSRERLLRRFKEADGSVLVGTDSFWEGVSVKGDALRLVVIPRLPFRVPTAPVAQARYERLVAQGRDPFRAWSLPEAVIKLRQGFGRLIRSRTDRGVVALLDRRVNERWYGRVFLNALPPARRVTGPSRRVLAALEAFYGEGEVGDNG
ncbi:MAG TPA: helicase C-terminal domain-containing protein [Myxococcota bacterium]|nr:helicase C-terminal domain-containing protein [Myxococcota bacterium]